MKKIYLLVSMLLATLLTQAQWTDGGTNLTTTDFVGIGTTTPSSYLEVRNPNVAVGDIATIANFTFRGSNHFGNGTNQQTEGKLVFSSQAFSNSPQRRAEIGFITSGYYQKGATLKFYTCSDDGNFEPTSRMMIDHDGKVGIGTSDFSGNHKLRVEGSIGAREIKVEATGWSDFVFERGYELRTLERVEEHINEKGHLPEIPSEAEVIENGIYLGEMNAKLLQKIEELTLYLIEQNKQNQDQQTRIEQLEQKISQLENE